MGYKHEFQSRYRAASHFRVGDKPLDIGRTPPVSISLSSGFSFQAPTAGGWKARLEVSISLSSGFSFQEAKNVDAGNHISVSISLSSGFSFQGKSKIFHCIMLETVSISLSSGFSFQAGSS